MIRIETNDGWLELDTTSSMNSWRDFDGAPRVDTLDPRRAEIAVLDALNRGAWGPFNWEWCVASGIAYALGGEVISPSKPSPHRRGAVA